MSRPRKPRNFYAITVEGTDEKYLVELQELSRHIPDLGKVKKRKLDRIMRQGEGFEIQGRILAGPDNCNNSMWLYRLTFKNIQPVTMKDLPLFINSRFKSDIYRKCFTKF